MVRTCGALVGLAAAALLSTGCGSKPAATRSPTSTGSATVEGAATERPPTRQQQAATETALDGEASSVATDLFNLTGEVDTLRSDVPDGAQTLAGERTDVQTGYHDLQLTNSTTKDRICGDADITRGDADTVQGDVDTQQGDDDTFSGDYRSVAYAISILEADDGQFRHDLAVVGDYTPGGAPSARAIAAAVTAARAAVTQGHSTLAADLATAKQLLQKANRYATQAQSVCTTRGP
jgi:hypothetical protein